MRSRMIRTSVSISHEKGMHQYHYPMHYQALLLPPGLWHPQIMAPRRRFSVPHPHRWTTLSPTLEFDVFLSVLVSQHFSCSAWVERHSSGIQQTSQIGERSFLDRSQPPICRICIMVRLPFARSLSEDLVACFDLKDLFVLITCIIKSGICHP